MVNGPGPVSWYGFIVDPVVRDADLYSVCIPAWFIFFYVLAPMIGKTLLGKKYTKLSAKDRSDWDCRLTSVLNGLISAWPAYLFITQPMPECDLYAVRDGYRFNRVCITSYFFWDLFTCFYYNWDLPWKIHGIVSFVGTFVLAYPFVDIYATYFCGVFELSNIFLHTSSMMEMTKTMPSVSTALKYSFAVAFTFIRVIFGSLYAYRFLLCDYALLMSGTYHHIVPVFVTAFNIGVVQLLQYWWFWIIIKTVLGMA